MGVCVWVGQNSLFKTRISGPDGPLILAVDLRNTPKGGGYKRTHTLLYIYRYDTLGVLNTNKP